MKIKDVVTCVGGEIIAGQIRDAEEIEFAFASDLMSDVLTIRRSDFMLITGLANVQSIRTAEMSDLHVVMLVRGKKVTPDMLELAEDNDIIVISCPFSMFKTSGLLYAAGLKPVY